MEILMRGSGQGGRDIGTPVVLGSCENEMGQEFMKRGLCDRERMIIRDDGRRRRFLGMSMQTKKGTCSVVRWQTWAIQWC